MHWTPSGAWLNWRMVNSRALTATALVCFLLPGFCAEGPAAADVKASLARATEYLVSLSTEGGYLWRYSGDLSQRWGEEEATDTQIWVQPPGTPSVGTAFLAAHKATGDERHLDAAEAAALALARGQLESGGWAYVVEFDPVKRKQWRYRTDAGSSDRDRGAADNTTTFDDNNTQSALRFLMAFLDAATNRSAAATGEIRSALDFGLAKMIEAQYPNGAWPQRWDGRPRDPSLHPVRKASIPAEWPHTWARTNYGNYYTLNDGAQQDCIETMLEAFHRLGDDRYLKAAKRGGDFLVLAQLPEPQPGWAQQYNFDMEPAWARAFEPPAVCSSESAVAVRVLVDLFLETGERRYLEPIPPFIEWLKRSQLGPDRWARLYELGSNKPLYGDRDGLIHYTLGEISEERRRGYGWQGGFGVPESLNYYETAVKNGPTGWKPDRGGDDESPTPSTSRVARILEQQDERGRWTRGDWVDMRTFVINMRALSAYLEADPAGDQP